MYPVFFSLLRRSASREQRCRNLLGEFISQNFREDTFLKKTFSLGGDAIRKLHVRQNSLYKNVILVPYNKITVVYLQDKELCLNLIAVGMWSVQLYLVTVLRQAETLFSGTSSDVLLVLMTMWALKKVRDEVWTNYIIWIANCSMFNASL